MENLDLEFSTVLDRFERGEVDILDVALAMTETIGLCSPEIYARARKLLEAKMSKKKLGKPKSITQEQVEKIHELKKSGMAQEKIAFEVGLSLSSVRRELKVDKCK